MQNIPIPKNSYWFNISQSLEHLSRKHILPYYLHSVQHLPVNQSDKPALFTEYRVTPESRNSLLYYLQILNPSPQILEIQNLQHPPVTHQGLSPCAARYPQFCSLVLTLLASVQFLFTPTEINASQYKVLSQKIQQLVSCQSHKHYLRV